MQYVTDLMQTRIAQEWINAFDNAHANKNNNNADANINDDNAHANINNADLMHVMINLEHELARILVM